MFDDLGLVRFRTEPWRFARRVAAGVGLVVWLAAAVQGDPLDGLLSGVAEGLACLGASPCSGGTSPFAASIERWPSPRPSATSQT